MGSAHSRTHSLIHLHDLVPLALLLREGCSATTLTIQVLQDLMPGKQVVAPKNGASVHPKANTPQSRVIDARALIAAFRSGQDRTL